MKKFAKAMVVGGITLGTVLGFNVTEHNGVSNEAQAQTHTSQGYYYHGYTKSGGEFVLNHTFYNALKAGNVTFNGIKVNDQYQNGTSTTTKYDQTFNQVKGNTAAMIDFKVAPKKVSLEQVKDVYGDHYQYQQPLSKKQADKTEGLYGYTVGKGHITFHVTDGYVDHVTVS
ncbi:immunodominant staphylococcal antigen IsaB family protein [Staphylococcus hominis]|uniref:immunodominant staphylococcal antigen IsaB family protein n=1 Tax=Staphylococcus hominis TaxID=1290 RepID=UPI003019AC0D